MKYLRSLTNGLSIVCAVNAGMANKYEKNTYGNSSAHLLRWAYTRHAACLHVCIKYLCPLFTECLCQEWYGHKCGLSDSELPVVLQIFYFCYYKITDAGVLKSKLIRRRDMINKVNELRQIGSRMSVCRQNRNMTQEELANRLGITPQALSKWERGVSQS